MKKMNNRYLQGLLMALCATLALSLASCVKTPDNVDPMGDMITFGAATGYQNDIQTRTEYSGLDEDGAIITSTSQYERIDWVATKDRVRILCAQAVDQSGEPNTAGTWIVGTPSASGANSSADITPADGTTAFFWGEGAHYFYALYPAAGTEANYDATAVVTDNDSKIEPLSGTNKAKITGAIPATQTCVKVDTVFKPNMNFAYMYAAEKTTRTADSKISLNFKPLVTTFQFSLKALDAAMAGADLQSLKLSSTSTDMTGGFTATLDKDAETIVDFVKTGTSGREITVTLPANTRLAQDKYSVITVLALGVPQTDLTLTLNFAGGVTRSLALTKTEGSTTTSISVDAYKKCYIKLGVPGGASTLEYSIGSLQDVTLSHFGGNSQISATTEFKSYKTINGVTEEDVPYKLMYSSDGGATWVDEEPDWFTVNDQPRTRSNTKDATSQTLHVHMVPQANSGSDPHGDILRARQEKEDFDLSTINMATGETVATTTANCYVVQAPGTYKFPLVYGNGIKGGAVNAIAYTPTGGFAPLVDHLDQPITSPYITVQQAGKAMAPTLVWCDAGGLVADLDIDGGYLTFSVPAATITQGNALLGVLVDDDNDGTPETIAWSWHIWVTDLNLPDCKPGLGIHPEIVAHAEEIGCPISNPPVFAQWTVGWCEGKTEEYEQRSYKVKAVQLEPATGALESDPVTVLQLPETIITRGNNLYYQWGRKDPMPAGIGDGNTFRDYYSDNPATQPSVVADRVSWGTAISHPYVRYYISDAQAPGGHNDCPMWSNQDNNDTFLWDATISYTQYAGDWLDNTKTIYDPSPVGFKVPNQGVFSNYMEHIPECQWYSATTTTVAYMEYTPTGLKFPMTGIIGRFSEDVDLNGVNSGGFYWTAGSGGGIGQRPEGCLTGSYLLGPGTHYFVSMAGQCGCIVLPTTDTTPVLLSNP